METLDVELSWLICVRRGAESFKDPDFRSVLPWDADNVNRGVRSMVWCVGRYVGSRVIYPEVSLAVKTGRLSLSI